MQEAVERLVRGNGGDYLQEVTHQLGVFRGKKESEKRKQRRWEGE